MRIHQIIPAQPGWHLEKDDGTLCPIICWALVNDPNSPAESPGDSVVVPVLEDERSLGIPYVPVGNEILRNPDDSYEYFLGTHGQPEGNWRGISVAHAETDAESVTVTLWCRPKQ